MMGQHKHNPTAIAAANGMLSPSLANHKSLDTINLIDI